MDSDRTLVRLKEGAAMFDKIRLRDVLVDYKLDFVSNE